MKSIKKITVFLIFIFILIIVTLYCNRFIEINKFLNYDVNSNMFTRFDLTVYLEDEIITNIATSPSDYSDRIELIKNLKKLEKIKFNDFSEKRDVDMAIIIQDEKLLNKNNYNTYFANISIYLEDNIICLNILRELHNENSSIKKVYYKMNDNSKKLVEKIIDDAINEQYNIKPNVVYYVLNNEYFYNTDISELKREYSCYDGIKDDKYPFTTLISLDKVNDIKEFRENLFINDIDELNLLPNTIVSRNVLNQWKSQNYDGSGSYSDKSPKGLTYSKIQ
ncbi:hypothetical protein H8S20_09355 [Clostridium sp. NSJ-6]|uniref:Lipoprotein n=1 Tax=Clostridium hominis TaxID=2763036 RepID=A0ABR7DD71_9CLOT|nr:hypothetical protein [Clostridium hominis]MBC5629097.1 hypothetical protein [Clostridium hominis]